MKISIIICSYNRAGYIEKSIKSALNQTFTDFEIIVIDDSSKDNTEDIVKSLIQKDSRIKYFKNEINLGISKSRNKGILLAEGEYIAMLDSDDYWLDNKKIEKQIEILEKNKGIGLIGSNILCIDKDNKELKKYYYESEDKKIRQKILLRNQFAQSSIIFRKKLIEKTGLYNTEFDGCEDLDLWLRIGQNCNFANLNEVTTAYLVHPGGISKQKKFKIAKNIYLLIKKYKKIYPNYTLAKIKAILRIIKSFF